MAVSATVENRNGASRGTLATAVAAFAVCLVTMMTVLDTTIANVSLATIAGNIGASSSQATWVITFYGVANAVIIPISGWLAMTVGATRLFSFCTALFVLASLLCGLSDSLGMLIACRILQGAAAGPLMPLSQSLLIDIFPASRRALALWSMTMVVASVLGAILGGTICENWSWHWVFFVNVPVGLLALVLLKMTLDHEKKEGTARPMDLPGLLLLVIGIGALQLMLDEGKDEDWFESIYICVLAVVAILSLSLLVFRELAVKTPVVDLRLFANRNFAIGTICLCAGYGIYFAATLLLPMMQQGQPGYTASWAGWALAPVGIIPIVTTPILGKFSAKLPMRLLASLAFLGIAVTCWWRSTIAPDVDFATIAWQQFWMGLAVAFFLMPVTSILLSGLTTPEDVTNATSLSTSLRVLSGSIASSLTTTFWSRREALHHERFTEAFDGTTTFWADAAETLGGAADPSTVVPVLVHEITRQGYLLGFVELFRAFMILGLLFAVVIC